MWLPWAVHATKVASASSLLLASCFRVTSATTGHEGWIQGLSGRVHTLPSAGGLRIEKHGLKTRRPGENGDCGMSAGVCTQGRGAWVQSGPRTCAQPQISSYCLQTRQSIPAKGWGDSMCALGSPHENTVAVFLWGNDTWRWTPWGRGQLWDSR